MRWKDFEKEYEARGIADKVRVDLVPNNGALDDRDPRRSRPPANTSCASSSAACGPRVAARRA